MSILDSARNKVLAYARGKVVQYKADQAQEASLRAKIALQNSQIREREMLRNEANYTRAKIREQYKQKIRNQKNPYVTPPPAWMAGTQTGKKKPKMTPPPFMSL